MRRSIRKFNIPPRATPGHLNFWRLACSNSLPSGQKSRSNAPPISTELPLLKGKFHLQSHTLHAFQRVIRRNDTFILLLKTLLKELFTNKGEILSCKSAKPCKNRKTHGRITSVGGENLFLIDCLVSFSRQKKKEIICHSLKAKMFEWRKQVADSYLRRKWKETWTNLEKWHEKWVDLRLTAEVYLSKNKLFVRILTKVVKPRKRQQI